MKEQQHSIPINSHQDDMPYWILIIHATLELMEDLMRSRRLLHWKLKVVMMQTLLSLVSLDAVVMPTYGAVSDGKVVMVPTYSSNAW